MKARSFGSLLIVTVALLACARTAPSAAVSTPLPPAPLVASAPSAAPREVAPSMQCLPATHVSPCGASGWELEQNGHKVMAFVTGPGSPSRLDLDVLDADNRYTICGRWSAFPLDDLECGMTPHFMADHFSVSSPVKRRSCLLDECHDVAGAPHLTPADLDSRDQQLGCQPDGACRIVDADDDRPRTVPTFYIREKGVGPFLLGMPMEQALAQPGFELTKSDAPSSGAAPFIAVRVAGEHVLDLVLDQRRANIAEIRVLTPTFLTQAGIRPGMHASELAKSHDRPLHESSRGEQTCATFEHADGLAFCFAGKARWSKTLANDASIASILVVPH